MIELAGKHIHFIGIGGISMSGLAEILALRGCTVSGSDRSDSPTLARLRAQGITCYVGHAAPQAQGADLVVYNAAIPAQNPEYAYALQQGIPLWRRSQLLGEIMRGYDVPVVISGTHGKTTTCGMMATVFEGCDAQPTVHNGGVMPLFGDATHIGGGHFFLAEGCEYTESFLDFFPRTAVLLNIDEDHLDYYRDIEHIQQSFEKYVARLPQDGLVLYNGDDPRCAAVAATAPCRGLSFGIGGQNDYHAEALQDARGLFSFDLYLHDTLLARVTCPVAGRHNVYNATAAVSAAHAHGLDTQVAARALLRYRGTDRRLQKTGTCKGCDVYQDYAHHPAELQAVLHAVKLMGYNRVLCAFQPHTYSRTKKLFDRFAHAFDACDMLVLLDIYAAREVNTGEVSSPMLQQAIRATGAPADCRYAPDFAAAAALLRQEARPGDVILTLGAGSIENLNPMLHDN